MKSRRETQREQPVAIPPAPPPERLITVQAWASGRTDAVARAFVAEQARGRVVKRGASEWANLFREFTTAAREA